MSKDIDNIKDLVKKNLAEHLGVEPEDIEDEDSLISDLHMKATDLSDFIHILNEKGFNTTNLDLTQIETLSELVEALGYEEL